MLDRYIEALIFSTEHAVTLREIKQALETTLGNKVKQKEMEESIDRLKSRYLSENFAFELIEIAGGFQFFTKGAYHHVVSAFIKQKNKKRLSKAALETLSIVAYKQPVTKVELEQIRGVSADYSLQKLLGKELIEIKGRSDSPGRPLLYATSQKFMDYFGISSLKDLPKLRDFGNANNEIGEPTPIEEVKS